MRSLLFLLLLLVALVVADPSPSSDEPASLLSPDPAALLEVEDDINFTVADVDDFETAAVEAEEPADAETEAEAEEFNAEQVTEAMAGLRAPPKRRLATRTVQLPTKEHEPTVTTAPPSPKLGALPPQKKAREILSKRHAPRLALRRLPTKTSLASERRPVKQLPPLAPRKRAPQYRQQIINQEVVQPVVSVQPMLHQRVLTRTVYQPTMQKQPVIQPIITQPILRREIREQPIIQQQMHYQNIVRTREVKQPEIHEELKTKEETAPKQTVEAKGPQFPHLTAPPKKHH